MKFPRTVLNELKYYVYLGYYEIYGESKIKSNVLSKIPNKEGTEIYIIGHSLRGWNGAHLYSNLQNKGYNPKVLMTLDPVGTKVGVTLVSDIYWDYPNPKSQYWYNSYTSPEDFESDDYVARIGGQWIPSSGTLVNHQNALHHGQAGKMFKEVIFLKQSMSEMLLYLVTKYLQEA